MRPILHQAIHLQLKPSRLMLGLLSLISIICFWILLALPIAAVIKFTGMLLIVTSSIYFILRDALLLLPWSWQDLEVDSKGMLSLTNQRGQQFQPILDATTFIHFKLIILNFKRSGLRLLPLILLADQSNADDVRRLRVWLRWFKPEKTVVRS
jgi:hypothetical protein